MSDILIPITLLGLLALVIDPHPLKSSIADMRAMRALRWQPNRASVAWLQHMALRVGLAVFVNVHELFWG